MDIFTKTIVAQTTQLTRDYFIAATARKIAELGLETPTSTIEALADHILSGSDDEFTWDDGKPDQEITIHFTERDTAEFQAFSKRLVAAVPKIMESMADTIAAGEMRAWKKDWPARDALEQAEHFSFQERLENRWGRAFSLLRMLLSMSHEIGANNFAQFRRSRARKGLLRRGVLIRLHARACQTLREIIVLMENGLADGALTRWRTLHEITVVALVIDGHDDELAQRYADHELIEQKRARDLDQQTRASYGATVPPLRGTDHLQRRYDDLIAKYGKPFAEDYGWAAQHLNKARPTFRHLEDAADRAMVRSDYKLASYNVHAGASGIAFKLGALDRGQILAGASNAGFSVPGAGGAHAMTQLNFIVLSRKPTFAEVVQMKALLRINQSTVRAFQAAERKLWREHRAERGAKEEGRSRPGKRKATGKD